MKTYVVLSLLLGFPGGVAAQVAVNETSQSGSSGSPTLSRQANNKALILRYYEEVWHKDNFDFADEIFVPDYIRHDPGALVNEQQAQQPGPGELARELKQSADTRFTFDVVLAEDDLVAVRWTNRVTWAGVPSVLRAIVGKRGPVETTGVNAPSPLACTRQEHAGAPNDVAVLERTNSSPIHRRLGNAEALWRGPRSCDLDPVCVNEISSASGTMIPRLNARLEDSAGPSPEYQAASNAARAEASRRNASRRQSRKARMRPAHRSELDRAELEVKAPRVVTARPVHCRRRMQ